MGRYANKTNVSSEKSKGEIEKILTRYGATGFIYGWQETSAVVAFQLMGKHIKFFLPLPDRHSKEFMVTDRGRKRKQNQIELVYEQAIKTKWRSLALTIKAKLASVEEGIEVFETAFMGQLVLPNGRTVEQHMLPQINESIGSKDMPPLLDFDR